MATDTAEPSAPPAASSNSASSNRFFGWMRATGIVRQPGWIGGVCAGIGERLGIDPLIVRGIAVVVAVLGGPAILLYAAAWLLLPDRFDRIHLEQLFRGRVDAPIAAIGVLIILSLLPVTQGFWSIGAAYWNGGATVGRVIWTIVLLATIVGVIVWVARRNEIIVEKTDVAASAVPDVATSATATTPTVPLSSAPTRPGADATTEDFAVWREQQSAWKAERAEFRAHQAASLQETNRARARERREAAVARNLEYLERQARWRKANPRLPGALVATGLGLAILAGAVAGLTVSGNPEWRGAEVAAGLGVATIALGVVIVIAAAAGRRNGFLVFLSVVGLVATLVAALVPNDRELVGVDAAVAVPGTYTQVVGRLRIEAASDSTGTIDVWQGAGSTTITVDEGQTVQLIETRSGDTYRTRSYGPSSIPNETIRLWQGQGSVHVVDENEVGK